MCHRVTTRVHPCLSSSSILLPVPGPHLDHSFFFFNDTATTEIYTLSLHDALPISPLLEPGAPALVLNNIYVDYPNCSGDRKSTRLNSSHQIISYAVFCLKKKKYERHATRPCRPSVLSGTSAATDSACCIS